MSKVVHCKKDKFDVYIGRPSKWGNPFSHKEGTLAKYKVNSREEAVSEFEKWIKNGEGLYLLESIHELKGKVLGCWCSPQLCHGHILEKIANKIGV